MGGDSQRNCGRAIPRKVKPNAESTLIEIGLVVLLEERQHNAIISDIVYPHLYM